MIEAYSIGVRMTINGNVGESVVALSAQFEALDRLITQTKEGLAQLGAGIRTTLGLGPVLTEARQFQDITKKIAADARATQEAYAAAMRNVPRQGAVPAGSGGSAAVPGAPSAAGPSDHDFMAIGIAAALAGHFFTGGATAATDQGMKMGAARAGLMTQGFSDAQTQEAIAAALKAQREVKGSTFEGDIGLVGKLMAVVQDPKAAIKLMPEFARLGVVLDAQNKGAEGDALMAAIRAGEFRGVMSERDAASGEERINPERLAKFVRGVQATSVASHGQIGPAQIYQFLKSGGVTASMIDDESLFADSMALQLAMGSSKAGTALQALGMQFGSGRMSSGSFNLMEKMGLIADPSKAEKVGIGQYMLLPGAIDPKMADLATNKPAEFVTKYLEPHMRDFMKKEYGADYNKASPEEQQRMTFRMATSLASRQTGANEIVEVIRNLMLIERDRTAIRGAMGRDAYAIQTTNNPEIALNATTASFKALLALVGDAGMKDVSTVLDGTTAGLNALGKYAEGPGKDVARMLLAVAYGLGAILAVLGGAAMARFLAGPLGKLGLMDPAAVPANGFATTLPTSPTDVPALRPGNMLGRLGQFTFRGLGKGLLAGAAESGAEYYLGQGADALQDWRYGPGSAAQTRGDQRKIEEGNHFWHDLFFGPSLPQAPAPGGGGPVTMNGVVNMDGKAVGQFTATQLANAIDRPSMSGSLPDLRASPYAAIGLP